MSKKPAHLNKTPRRRIARLACSDWTVFMDKIQKYLALPLEGRERYLFRGQPDSTFQLTPTLDRYRTYDSVRKREEDLDRLVRIFQRESSGIQADLDQEERLERLEEIARHHGLPTRLLDWSQSPFIAAYFAFSEICDNLPSNGSKMVTVWRLRISNMSEEDVERVEIVPARFAGNSRAYAQRSYFTRLKTCAKHVNKELGGRIVRYDIPATQWEHALSSLDEMNISPSTMFPDLDGAAKAVWRRDERFE